MTRAEEIQRNEEQFKRKRIHDLAEKIYVALLVEPGSRHYSSLLSIINEAHDLAAAFVEDYREKEV